MAGSRRASAAETEARPTEPVYPFAAPGDPIPLYVGDMSLNGSEGSGRIWLASLGDVDHRWEFDGGGFSLDLQESRLAFEHPQLGPVEVPVRVTSSNGLGVVLPATLGSPQQVDEVVIHWMNMPAVYPATALRSDSQTWAGRWSGNGGGWSLVLDSRPDLAAVMEEARGTPSHVVTHTGRLTRADGTAFSPAEATDALAAWQTAFSFALGRWVTPALAAGFTGGVRSWESWSPWRCDALRGRVSWWDTHRGDDLASFVALFLDAWTDPSRHDRARHVAHHVIESNEPAMTLEARVMLAGASLEYLSWVVHVLGGKRSATQHRARSAAENLRELVVAAQIPVDVPPELDALEQLRASKGMADAPEAIAWVRNRLVHPKDAGEPYRLDHLVLQTWQLVMHYAELLALHDLGYAGSFCKRYPPGGWAHTSIPVPWAP